MNVKLSEIQLKPNVRKTKPDITDLKASIEKHGLLQPLVVKQKNGQIELVAGYRRFKAISELGWPDVQVHLINDPEADSTVLQTAENTFRTDMTLYEEVMAVKEYLTKKKLSVSQIADLFGHSESWVRARLKYGNLVPKLLPYLERLDGRDLTALSLIASYSMKNQRQAVKDIEERYGEKVDEESIYEIAAHLKDREDEALVAGFPWLLDDERWGPKCEGCKFRSSNQRRIFSELFSDEADDHCLNKECRDGKYREAIGFIEEYCGELDVKVHRDLQYYIPDSVGKHKVTGQARTTLGRLLSQPDKGIRNFFFGRTFRSEIPTRTDSQIYVVTTKQPKSTLQPRKARVGALTRKKLYRYLHPRFCASLWDSLVQAEPDLLGPISYRLLGYAIVYADTVRTLADRSYRLHADYEVRDWFDFGSGLEVLPDDLWRRFRISVLRQFFWDSSLYKLMVKMSGDAVSRFSEDAKPLPSDEDVVEKEKWHLHYPSVAGVLGFDVTKWLRGLIDTEDKRIEVFGMFTKAELIEMLPNKKRNGLSGRNKAVVRETVARRYTKVSFPFEKFLFKTDTDWLTVKDWEPAPRQEFLDNQFLDSKDHLKE